MAEYRPVDSGVEVDIWLKATKADHPVWESLVTMLSPRDSSIVQLQASGEDGKRDQKVLIRFVKIRLD